MTNSSSHSSGNDLQDILSSLKTDIINSLQAKGVGNLSKTATEITISTGTNKAQLQIPGYLHIVETGCGPTSKNPQRGNVPMIQRIQQWCRENGIPDKAAWAIKKSIDKHGFKGKPGLLSEPLSTENISLRLQPVMTNIANKLTTEILINL